MPDQCWKMVFDAEKSWKLVLMVLEGSGILLVHTGSGILPMPGQATASGPVQSRSHQCLEDAG